MQSEHQIVRDVYAAKQNTQKADHLIRAFIPFIRSETGRFLSRSCSDQDDEYAIAMAAFYEAIQGYDRGRGAFLSYAAVVIRSRLIDYQRKESRHHGQLSLHEETADDSGKTRLDLLADPVDRIGALAVREATQQEIAELSTVMDRFGVSFSDVADHCPKQARTLAACTKAIRYATAPAAADTPASTAIPTASDATLSAAIPTASGTTLSADGILYLSVNPKIAVHCDADGKVTRLEACNKDADAILETVTDFEGKDARQVVTELVDAIGETGYFVDDIDGESKTITIELEPGSVLPVDTFLEDIAAETRDYVSRRSWAAPADPRSEVIDTCANPYCDDLICDDIVCDEGPYDADHDIRTCTNPYCYDDDCDDIVCDEGPYDD